MTKVNQTEPYKTTAEMTDRQEKPIIGGGMAIGTGAIKKAKSILKAEKKRESKKILQSNEDKQKCISVEKVIAGTSDLSQVSPTIESYELNSPRLLNRRESLSPEEPMENMDFEFPRKYTAWSELIKTKSKRSFEIDTSNKYNSLSSDSEEEDGAKAVSGNQQKNTPRKKLILKKYNKNQSRSQNNNKQGIEKRMDRSEGRRAMPPPVVLKGELENLGEVKRRLREECNIHKVNFKYTRYNTLISVENEIDHNKLVEYFKQQQVDTTNKKSIEFHTYTTAPKKTHAFVVRGLDCHPEPDEVRTAFLEEYEIEISSVYQMHTKYRPLYMIVTSSAITQKYLQNTVKYLMSVRVFIEERQNVRRIIQCHRCQEWGHATSNCYRSPRCLKCAEGHATKECKKSTDTEPKCCNCGGNHPANATICKVYQNKLIKLENKGGQNQKYVPAPLPKVNAWEGGARAVNKINEKQVQQRTSGSGTQPVEDRELPQKISATRNENARNYVVDEVTNSVRIVQELNNKFNFKELNRALNDLNGNMRYVKTGVEAFQVYYQFIENLENNYNILN